MLRAAWEMTKDTLSDFLADDALSRGAAIAFYAITSLAPVLVIVVAVAGLIYGRDAARGLLVGRLSGVMGPESAATLQALLKHASQRGAGLLAGALGIVTLIVTATGVFAEMQTALNVIWQAKPSGGTAWQILRGRLAGLLLVALLGVLLLLLVPISAVLSAVQGRMGGVLPLASSLMQAINFGVEFVLLSILFAAIYKALPDCHLRWRDVAVGAMVTSVLFGLGRYLIGLYIATSGVSSTYGAAGSLVVILFWIYYSAQIFLLGAEFTKAFARRHGNLCAPPSRRKAAAPSDAQPSDTQAGS